MVLGLQALKVKRDVTSESEVCVKPSKYFYIRKNTKE